MSLWSEVPEAAPDPIFHLAGRCKADPFPNKVDLGVGAYRDEEGRPYLLRVVAKVEQLLADKQLDKEYLPIDGLAGFREESVKLLLGDESKAIKEKRVASCQALSGTGALRLAAEFYAMFVAKTTPVYISNPTWGNHAAIFKKAGFPDVREYRYFDPRTKGVDFEGFTADLRAAPDRAIIILQLCAHNPTGADPTKEQWLQLANISREKSFIILFDSAYQGYATGDLDNDAYGARLFESEGIQFACAQSYAKNFGLYSERIGCLSFVTATSTEAVAVNSQLKVVVRPMYSNPPVHGARIVHTVLSTPELRAEWIEELKGMSARIRGMRQALQDALAAKGTPGDWSHITKQIGMFSFTGLTPAQSEAMVDQHHVYMLKNGRISVAGLSAKTVPYVADAIHKVVTGA